MKFQVPSRNFSAVCRNMPKTTNSTKLPRHDPLAKSIEEGSGNLRTQTRRKQHVKSGDSEKDAGYVDSRTSRRILDLAREQQLEMAAEARELEMAAVVRHPELSVESDAYEENDDEVWTDDGEDQLEYEELDLDIDPDEDALFEKYVAQHEGGGSKAVTLADKIMEKVAELEAKQNGTWVPPQEQEGVMLPQKVVDVFSQVGELLSRYRSGRLPRAFKIVPTLRNWRDVLYVTNPSEWSNQAVYEATKLFVSNLPSPQAHRFIGEVLLERFKRQVEQDRTVNYHVYRALKKALYKPAAFFKGFLFPLLESGTCTLRDAIIASSVIARVSIPALHSAAALLHIAELVYSSANSLFIKTLLDKKYALPYRVIDAMVFHFVRFRENEEQLPVIWHQSFLVFAQRYKNDITDDQRDALMAVVRLQCHAKIAPEIRRELLVGEPRQS